MKRTATALTIFISFYCHGAFAQETPRFFHLTSSDGLSHDHVNAIVKGSRGFIWIATDDGLNQYDGYQFTTYRHDVNDPKSIHDNLVYDIYESDDKFWIGTASGLERLDRKSGSFTHFSPEHIELAVHDVFSDSKNRIWLGTSEGLYSFNSTDGTFRGMDNKAFIYRIAEDRNGELWIASKQGLHRFLSLIHI